MSYKKLTRTRAMRIPTEDILAKYSNGQLQWTVETCLEMLRIRAIRGEKEILNPSLVEWLATPEEQAKIYKTAIKTVDTYRRDVLRKTKNPGFFSDRG